MTEKSWRDQRNERFWLTIAIVLMLGLGVGFRFVNLDRKVYWTDETYTSLRVSGYTEAEFTQQVFNGKLIRAVDLQQYQHPSAAKSNWTAALNAFVGSAEHSPLYFVLARLWAQSVGSSIGAIRCLSALISLGVFPSLYWLCRELFGAQATGTAIDPSQSKTIGGVALALVAVSPLHVLYAQEARQYSLLTVATLLACAALLRAMRIRSLRSWGIYAASIALGLYSHILFGLVVIAHALYVVAVERFSKVTLGYGLSSGAGLLLFAPWLAIVLTHLDTVQTSIAAVYKADSFSYIVNRWLKNLSLVFVNQELGSANLIVLLLAAVSLYFLWRNSPRRLALFVLLLIAGTTLPLVLPDLLWGGQRSLRIRYLIPCYLGIQISIAYWLTTLAMFRKGWQQKLGSLLLATLLAAGIWGCAVSSQAEVWWNKSLIRSGYFPDVAQIINQTANPLVISDSLPIDLLAFSHELKPDVHLQLATVGSKIRVAPGFDAIFLFNPSNRLRNRLANLGYQATPAYRDAVVTRLWRLRRADL